MAMTLYLHNTLTRRKEPFTPLDTNNVRMYVCGPTVYDRPHIGNARSVVVYDVLFRLLSQVYGEKHVTYVRNITDVDDKINARAKERGIPIQQLTTEVTAQFHADMDALSCLRPTHEPRATGHIADMQRMIRQLLDSGHAYAAQGHVLFDVTSYAGYGALSGRKADEQLAGARVAVESYKKNPGDFVLWKPADSGDDASSVFDSPWGAGRPGWHIECSAMSSVLLGPTFDIHGGGADLMFPHHENEIAQSRCADGHSEFAKCWVHNGFLTVNGEKMSKSLGNFVTVKELLDKGVKGEVIRFALLSAKYNEPLDWNEKLIHDAKVTLDKWYRLLERHARSLGMMVFRLTDPLDDGIMQPFVNALYDDLNLPKAMSVMHQALPRELAAMGAMLGLLQQDFDVWFKGFKAVTVDAPIGLEITSSGSDEESIKTAINQRIAAKKAKNFAEADRIRKELADQGIILEDRPDGTTDWRRA